MKIAIVGGGPGGLFLASLLGQADPSLSVTVFERNRAKATFGFGVVFSDRTLDRIHEADPTLRQALETHGRHWDTIEVRLKNQMFHCGGNGMAAVSRQVLLDVMQERARSTGATLHFDHDVVLEDLRDFDLVVAADGGGSKIREQLSNEVRPSATTATARFIWLGTPYMFDGLTFIHERSEHGVFAVHGYPISDSLSTFIVETNERSFRNAGLDAFDVTQAPGTNDEKSISYLQSLFSSQIDGAELVGNNSRWGQFITRKAQKWSVLGPQPVVFIGDAVHTAHFSVGSGTKMAMEDAIELSRSLVEHQSDLALALRSYEAAARPPVEAIQRAAAPSLSWWEHFGLYHDSFEPWQFAYHFMSRSISDGRLRRRAPKFADDALASWVEREGSTPIETPILVGTTMLPTRLVTHSGNARDHYSTGLSTSSPAALPQTGDRTFLSSLEAGALKQDDHKPDVHKEAESRPGSEVNVVSSTQTGATWVVAPDVASHDTSEALVAAIDKLLSLVAALDPDLCGPLVITRGTAFTRSLLSEQIRLRLGAVTVLHEPTFDADQCRTAVLSGRTDLVAFDETTSDNRSIDETNE